MDLVTKEIGYTSSGAEISAFVAYEDRKERMPGLIIIHEIFGLNDHVREVARRFAMQGYAVIAPHLYSRPGNPTGEEIQKAMRFMYSLPQGKQRDQAFVQEQMGALPEAERESISGVWGWMTRRDYGQNVADLRAAFNWMKDQEFVDGNRMGCLGFCMGGTLAGRLASSGEELKAAIIFYGENPPSDQIVNIRCPILGLYGGEDHRITDRVPELENEMRSLDKSFVYKIYPNAHHAFFNETGRNFNKEAADDAWRKANEFLKENLK